MPSACPKLFPPLVSRPEISGKTSLKSDKVLDSTIFQSWLHQWLPAYCPDIYSFRGLKMERMFNLTNCGNRWDDEQNLSLVSGAWYTAVNVSFALGVCGLRSHLLQFERYSMNGDACRRPGTMRAAHAVTLTSASLAWVLGSGFWFVPQGLLSMGSEMSLKNQMAD